MSWYLDIVSEEWYGLVWPSETSYKVVFPLPVRRKWGIKIVQQPHFCQYLGLFAAIPLSPELGEAFLRALQDHFSYVSCYCFHPRNTPLLRGLRTKLPGLPCRIRHTQLLFCGVPYSEIRRGYHTDLRNNLKRAEKSRWQLHESASITPLLSLFREHHSPNIPGGTAPESYRVLERLFQRLSPEQRIRIVYASRAGKIHAGIMLLTDPLMGDTYIFNAADPEGRKGNARVCLLDRYFREKAGTPVLFDFESPETESIKYFYGKFGAVDSPYYAIRYNRLPTPFRRLQELRLRLLGVRSW